MTWTLVAQISVLAVVAALALSTVIAIARDTPLDDDDDDLERIGAPPHRTGDRR